MVTKVTIKPSDELVMTSIRLPRWLFDLMPYGINSMGTEIGVKMNRTVYLSNLVAGDLYEASKKIPALEEALSVDSIKERINQVESVDSIKDRINQVDIAKKMKGMM